MNIIRRNSKESDEMNELKEKKVHPKNKDQKWCWCCIARKQVARISGWKKDFLQEDQFVKDERRRSKVKK